MTLLLTEKNVFLRKKVPHGADFKFNINSNVTASPASILPPSIASMSQWTDRKTSTQHSELVLEDMQNYSSFLSLQYWPLK